MKNYPQWGWVYIPLNLYNTVKDLTGVGLIELQETVKDCISFSKIQEPDMKPVYLVLSKPKTFPSNHFLLTGGVETKPNLLSCVFSVTINDKLKGDPAPIEPKVLYEKFFNKFGAKIGFIAAHKKFILADTFELDPNDAPQFQQGNEQQVMSQFLKCDNPFNEELIPFGYSELYPPASRNPILHFYLLACLRKELYKEWLVNT